MNSPLLFYPSAVADYLACAHLTALSRAHDAGEIAKPHFADPGLDLLRELGLAHEQKYLRRLIDDGFHVTTIPVDSWENAAASTIQAMRDGAAVIYQPAFVQAGWCGRADFLTRVERPGGLGAWSYEVVEVKLARSTKVRAILQLCFYSGMLSTIQGVEPEWMHVVLGGNSEPEKFQYKRYAAYFRKVMREFEAAYRGRPQTHPEPVEHCRVCGWSTICKDKWKTDDHLSLVAGISGNQRKALNERGINNVADLAAIVLPLDPKIERIGEQALLTIYEQARLQVQGRTEGRYIYELITPPENERGLCSLPSPSAGDLFLDFEGDPYAFDDGLEYLFGFVTLAEDLSPVYNAIWAMDRAAEKKAFEEFIDLVMDRLRRYPDMHIYHYAVYEETAVKRMAGRHATRVEEVDQLLRGGIFVDLFRAVRQGLRASVESYSIKKMEPLYGFERRVQLLDANLAMQTFQWALTFGPSEEDLRDVLRAIEGYNKDDCLSAFRLRAWLEERRQELEQQTGEPLPRPTPADGKPKEELSARIAEVEALVKRLTHDLPTDAFDSIAQSICRGVPPWAPRGPSGANCDGTTGVPTEGHPYKALTRPHRSGESETIDNIFGAPEGATEEQCGRWLLAHLLDWHRREEKSAWWRYYERCDMSDEQLQADKSSLGGLVYVGEIEKRKRSLIHRYRFPLQDHAIDRAPSVHDPVEKKDAGAVVAIDDRELTIDIKRGENSTVPHPKALIPFEVVNSIVLRDSLLRLGYFVADHGIENAERQRVARDLLLRRSPRLRNGSLQTILGNHANVTEAAKQIALQLDHSTLPIQGPPGSGKTYIGARMILELVSNGRRVGVTANSHKVVTNLLNEICQAAREAGTSVRIIQKSEKHEACVDEMVTCLDDNAKVSAALEQGQAQIVAGTVWLWSREEMASSVDVLFVDEAGQMSLANVLAASQAGESLVLLGDPQQLDQPQRGVHPPGADVSALSHLLDGQATIGADRGLFLAESWRLHPDICAFTSEAFYDGRLESRPENATQRLNASASPLDGTGLRFAPVSHTGNQGESQEEVTRIAELIDELFRGGATWTNKHGEILQLQLKDILIVAPYNAQVSLLAQHLPPEARIGTVDKFQGQEAPLVFYSMTTSSPDDAPRGMEFLYSANRLNVATSRAQCVTVLVANPTLFDVQCRTPRQMALANAFCRYLELARD